MLLKRDEKPVPVFLVLDVSNESGSPIQATNSYLEIETSATDLQPFVTLAAWGETFQLSNHGWGPAENAGLNFASWPERPARRRAAHGSGGGARARSRRG